MPDSPWRPVPRGGPFPNHPRLRLRAAQGLTLLSLVWRRLMFRTKVVAITGSHGKSTATKCLGAILSARFPTNWSCTPANARWALSQNLLRTRPRHRFTVIEVGTRRPGAILRASWQFDPDIAAVLAVGLQHTNAFPDLEAMAAEKARMLRGIRGGRVAVLNGDDPLVRAMAARCRGRVLLFGRSPESDVRADDVSAIWPGRLCFTAHAGAETARIETQLVGEHWLPAVLGAIACAIACGLRLEDCVEPLRAVKPVVGRLSPHPLANGATILRDDHNASLATLGPALEVLRQARAGRRIVLMGDFFDSPDPERLRYEEMGRRAAAAADIAVFIGHKMNVAVRTAVAAGMDASAVRSIRRLEDAAEWLRAEMRPDDLVLLRERGQFHMERIYFAQLGSIQCWMHRCSLGNDCDTCVHLGFQASPGGQ